MRRLLAPFFLLMALAAPAWAQSDAPFVDVAEVAGVVDRQVEGYMLDRIDAAEAEGARLLVFQLDSLGGVKISDGDLLPPLVRRIRDAEVPVAIFIGPRSARASGLTLFLAQAAHVSAAEAAATLGGVHPIDLGHADRYADTEEVEALHGLAGARDRTLNFEHDRTYSARDAVQAGLIDMQVVSLADMLSKIDGRTVTTAKGPVRLELPQDSVDVRFFQPGLFKRLLHTFSNATLVYIMLMAAAGLLVFELFQPGFGVAGVTSGLLFAASIYGLTVLPADALGLGLFAGGLALMTLDVARDTIAPPTYVGTAALAAGTWLLFPRGPEPLTIPVWIVVVGVISAVIMFVPVMTLVRRARKPIATAVKRQLVGEPGQVRSMLNPEGFVEVGEEIWRARTEDGSRMRVGETVVVTGVVGTTLMVSPPVDGEAASAEPSPPADD